MMIFIEPAAPCKRSGRYLAERGEISPKAKNTRATTGSRPVRQDSRSSLRRNGINPSSRCAVCVILCYLRSSRLCLTCWRADKSQEDVFEARPHALETLQCDTSLCYERQDGAARGSGVTSDDADLIALLDDVTGPARLPQV